MRFCIQGILIITLGLIASSPQVAWGALTGFEIQSWAERDVQRLWIDSKLKLKPPALHWQSDPEPAYRIECPTPSSITILATGPSPSDQREQLYAALAEMGFAFPHPRMQISPNLERLHHACGRSGAFRARVAKRGFHLHTMHPSEWVNGFLTDDLSIADDTVRWLVRNQQNLLQIQVLRTSNFKHLRQALHVARQAGLQIGFSAAFAMQQQKALFLVPLWATFSGQAWKRPLQSRLKWIIDHFDFDFLCAEMGTTEFTATDADRTLEWIEETRRILKRSGKDLFIKIHTSTGQEDPRYGNYNFLARYSNPEVGVLPHTVMFYGLSDAETPMYGRKDFKDIRQFMLEESSRRPTWYYPETSYYVGMDIDVPIFLTDYLLARRADFEDLVANGIEGHLTFTTGQELGYWLFDWSTALQAWPEAADDPWLALRMLGEDVSVWKRIASYQNEFFKRRQIIRLISSSNLMDELPGFHPIHERTLIRELHRDRVKLESEIGLLEEAVLASPELREVHHPELRRLLEVTELRVKHALALRRVIAGNDRKFWRQQAARLRQQAATLLAENQRVSNRYPKSVVFQRTKNGTSYDEGYGQTASRLYFWKREEEMAANVIHANNPFFMPYYKVRELLF